MVDAFQFEFMRNAVAAGLMASVICGVIGTLIVVNRLVFLSGGIAHSAYGGIGLAAYFGFPYMAGASVFAMFSGFLMAFVTLKAKQRADTIVGVMWAVGMATGIIMLDITPGYNVDLMSYLFGSILSVPRSDLYAMALLGALILFLVIYFYRDLLILSYDEEFAQVHGVPVRVLYYLMIAMVSLAIIMVVQVVGLILVIALLTIPQYIAEKYTTSLKGMMTLSTFLGAFFITTGLYFSYVFDLTSGAVIILVSGIGFLMSLLIDKIRFARYRIAWLRSHETE